MQDLFEPILVEQKVNKIIINKIIMDSNDENEDSIEIDSDISVSAYDIDEEVDPVVIGNEEQFDTDLPAEHNYLGNLERVSGVQYLEPDKTYRLPIFFHDSLIFPGETLPMILTQQMFLATEFTDDGLLFGLVFHDIRNNIDLNLYGVTCQIYEKGSDGGDNISIKSKAFQRFCIKNDKVVPEFLISNRARYANIRILPEIVLSHPVYGFDSNSLSKFRLNECMKSKLLKYQCKSLAWPAFIFGMYDVDVVTQQIKDFLKTLKIETVPMDLVSLSFWFSQNAVLSAEYRCKAFLTNNVLARIFLIGKSLKEDKYIICKRCQTKLAQYDSLFAMSKEGVQTSYCNSAGFIHETHTITNTLPEMVLVSGPLSSEFSWFPGYAWRYVHCSHCSNHLGWKYFSVKPNVVPKTFIGLSGKSINIKNTTEMTPNHF